MISPSPQKRDGLAYLFAVRVAAQHFGCLALHDKGPYRLERRGVGDEFMLPPLGLKSRRWMKG